MLRSIQGRLTGDKSGGMIKTTSVGLTRPLINPALPDRKSRPGGNDKRPTHLWGFETILG
ncbi:MAG: hypothetical protein JEY79_19370 [Pseudodesulfovibrio sp.]|nr:hypothetical protein [Pseudodesulfovibrio sp.]